MDWTFGDCVLDVKLFELRRGERIVKIEPKVFDVLRFLVENRDRLVSKTEILDHVWAGDAVTESVLPRCIAIARQAVGDDRVQQRVIQTIHGRGYRFVAPLHERDPDAPSVNLPPQPIPPPPASDFVGRQGALERLDLAFEDTLAGRGRIVLLTGEPGIGKTRTAEQLLERAEGRAAAYVGRCFEGEGAPAYWPFVQILRSLSEEVDERQLAANLGVGAADILPLVPELAGALPQVPAPEPLEGEQARFRLFDSFAGFLRRCAAQRPLLLILDDLHWADRDSAQLVGFLAAALHDVSVLIVGTYRDVDVRREHPLRSVLGDLARMSHCERITLRGLDNPDVEELVSRMTGETVGDRLSSAITELTEGNPFFVREIALLLADVGMLDIEEAHQLTLELPQSIRDAVGRRLNSLSAECNELLRHAAVMGRDFSSRLLAEINGASYDAQLELIGEALARGILKEHDSAGSYSFSHALVQQTLYEELEVSERVLAHRKTADALERLQGDHSTEHLAELAHHLFESAIVGDPLRSVEVSVHAAELAHRQYAYGESARHYERAQKALVLAALVDEPRRCELLLAEAEAKWAAGLRDLSRERFRQAANLARELGRPELLARAAVGMSDYGEESNTSEADTRLLEESVEAVEDRFPIWRARILSRLVFSEPHGLSMDNRRLLSGQAASLAEESDDPVVLFDVLRARYWATVGPDEPDERVAIGLEATLQGQRLGDPRLVLLGHEVRVGAHLMLGEFDEADRHIRAFEEIALELRQPIFEYFALIQKGAFSMNCGRFDEAQEYLDQSVERGMGSVRYAKSLTAGAIYWLRNLRGDSIDAVEYEGNFVDLLRQSSVSGSTTIVKAAATLILVAVGRHDESHQLLREIVDGVDQLERNEHWLVTMSSLSESAVQLSEPEIGEVLFRLLLPYERLMFAHDLIPATNGSVGSALGALAGVCGRHDEAIERLSAAIEREDATGAQPAALNSRIRLARQWHRGGQPARAGEVAMAAAAAAKKIGSRVDLSAVLDTTPPKRTPPAGTPPAK